MPRICSSRSCALRSPSCRTSFVPPFSRNTRYPNTLGFADRHLGGEPAITAVLHTWGRNLSQHLHLHCLVSGGALSPEGRWNPARDRFLFPVRALAKVFRGKFLDGLSSIAKSPVLPSLRRTLRRRPWVVYCKPPFAGPETVLAYLARYTHRTALSNDRIVAFDGQTVRFRWRDHRDHRVKILALDAPEFLRRFLQHVLPHRFVRVRHYGILANRTRRRKLQACRQQLDVPTPPTGPAESTADLLQRLTGQDLDACPECRTGRLRTVAELPPCNTPHLIPYSDTS